MSIVSDTYLIGQSSKAGQERPTGCSFKAQIGVAGPIFLSFFQRCAHGMRICIAGQLLWQATYGILQGSFSSLSSGLSLSLSLFWSLWSLSLPLPARAQRAPYTPYTLLGCGMRLWMELCACGSWVCLGVALLGSLFFSYDASGLSRCIGADRRVTSRKVFFGWGVCLPDESGKAITRKHKTNLRDCPGIGWVARICLCVFGSFLMGEKNT